MPLLPEGHLGSDVDLRVDGPIDRAALGKEAVHPLGGLPLLRSALQGELHMDAPDDEGLAVQLHLSGGVRDELPGGCGDLARLQRASVGSDQSTRGGRHYVIQGGRMRLVCAGLGSVMDGHRPMRAELHRLLLLR